MIDQNNKNISFCIQLDAEIDTNALIIFIDECDNANNMYSDQSENHSYYFNQYNSDIQINDLGGFKYEITIAHDNIENMSHHMKYIKIITGADNYIVEGIYYNSSVIYTAEITHIKRICNMCLDDNTMKLLVHVVFKRQLLESALETDDFNKCMVLYNDLCRLLQISIYDEYCCDCVDSVNNECAMCSGGCCSLK